LTGPAGSHTLRFREPNQSKEVCMTSRRTLRALGVLALTALLAGGAQLSASAMHGVDALVTKGSPPSPFSENKENEPALAVDQNHPNILAAGANENIDLEACNAGDDTTCPFTPGVGTSGIYFSFDSGDTWIQPTYTGLSARSCQGTVGSSDPACTPVTGQIGTLPWYSENGLVSDGDPALAFGPAPGPDGFSWDNGDRLYYTNLTANLSAKRSEAGFKGVEGIGVSRTDDVEAAAADDKDAWMPPVVIPASGSSAGFADKEQIWADNAASSPTFGNVYLCFENYKGGPSVGSNTNALIVARSTDGGDAWSTQILVQNNSSSSGNLFLITGQSGCTIRTDSEGHVFVLWLGFDKSAKAQGIYLSKSVDGGQTYAQPRKLFAVVTTGIFDPSLGRNTEDGIAGARSDLSNAPSIDIANGAPTGDGATDQIVLSWVDGGFGLNHEPVLFSTSTDGGTSWSTPLAIDGSGVSSDRGFYSAPSISPDGTDVYVVYNAWLEPYKTGTTGEDNDRPLVGILTHADVAPDGSIGAFTRLEESTPGDARGSSQNDLTAEFLGDYVYAVATRDYGAGVWNDVRDAADCDALDAWRLFIRGGPAAPKPAPQQDCPETFGNSDIFSVSFADPSP
jgi:hypothetical protein